MISRSLCRLGAFALTAFLCLGYGEAKGCGGGDETGYDEVEYDEGGHNEGGHGHSGSTTGATCPPSNTLTAQSFGTAFLQAYCLSCHSQSVTGDARQGAPLGLDFDTLGEVHLQLPLIDTHAAAGPRATNTAMPPAQHPQPTQQEREKLGQWLACGAP